MEISNKMKLFKIYIKQLLTFVCEVLDLNEDELNELKICEGNVLKRIIGITKKCNTSQIYAAMSLESTKMS